MRMFLDPGIIIVLFAFFSVTIYVLKKYLFINKELTQILNFLKNFKKSDLKFRFNELDYYLSSNAYVSEAWFAFKNTLMFSENIALQDAKEGISYKNISEVIKSIQCTVEPPFFFNEETLVISKLNYRIVQVAPTVLTGLGPLFTFFHIGKAFAKVNFVSQEATVASVGGMMESMQLAASISVLAVGAALIFMIFEKLLYTVKCKRQVEEIESLISKLFDSISSEKFLIELLRETKIQNNHTKNLLTSLPIQFKDAMDKTLTTTLTPYLENILYSLNKLQEKIVATKNKKDSNSVDDLF